MGERKILRYERRSAESRVQLPNIRACVSVLYAIAAHLSTSCYAVVWPKYHRFHGYRTLCTTMECVRVCVCARILCINDKRRKWREEKGNVNAQYTTHARLLQVILLYHSWWLSNNSHNNILVWQKYQAHTHTLRTIQFSLSHSFEWPVRVE